ncbi:hypothetical protein, partial [Methanopyrus kandleri]
FRTVRATRGPAHPNDDLHVVRATVRHRPYVPLPSVPDRVPTVVSSVYGLLVRTSAAQPRPEGRSPGSIPREDARYRGRSSGSVGIR